MIKFLRHNSLIITQLVCRNYGKLTNGRSDMMGSHLENLKTFIHLAYSWCIIV